jgi:hypothetical protein
MPMLEVLRSDKEPLSPAQKRLFTREAVKIFQEVIGTPPGRLRLFFIDLPAEEQDGPSSDDADESGAYPAS